MPRIDLTIRHYYLQIYVGRSYREPYTDLTTTVKISKEQYDLFTKYIRIVKYKDKLLSTIIVPYISFSASIATEDKYNLFKKYQNIIIDYIHEEEKELDSNLYAVIKYLIK